MLKGNIFKTYVNKHQINNVENIKVNLFLIYLKKTSPYICIIVFHHDNE
jgi:hypothetical protein